MSDNIKNDPYSNPDLLKEDDTIYPDEYGLKKRKSHSIWFWLVIVIATLFTLAMILTTFAALFLVHVP